MKNDATIDPLIGLWGGELVEDLGLLFYVLWHAAPPCQADVVWGLRV